MRRAQVSALSIATTAGGPQAHSAAAPSPRLDAIAALFTPLAAAIVAVVMLVVMAIVGVVHRSSTFLDDNGRGPGLWEALALLGGGLVRLVTIFFGLRSAKAARGSRKGAAAPPRPLPALRARLSEAGREGFDQVKELHGERAVEGMLRPHKAADGSYDVPGADATFQQVRLGKTEFAEKLARREADAWVVAQKAIETVDNILSETSPAGRPTAAIGDGTAEAALLQEIATGQPVGNRGHSIKVSEAITGLRKAIGHLRGQLAKVKTPSRRAEIEATIQKAEAKIEKMEPAATAWRSRTAAHPAVWNSDGTSQTHTQPDGSPWPSSGHR